MADPLEDLIAILTLEAIGEDRWRGVGSKDDGAEGSYGGHLLGQAAAAMLADAGDDRILHSLHGYFLRGGIPGQAYDWVVQRVRDGRSISNRRASAYQDERLVFEASASLVTPASGAVIAARPPKDLDTLPAPESLPRYGDVMAAFDPPPLPAEWALREHGIDLRPVNAPWAERGISADGGIRHWIRANGRAPDDPALHAAMLLYQSDESLSDCLLIPFGLNWGSPNTQFVSLDHAAWLHEPVDLNDWLFVEQWPSTARNERGLAHGRVWRRDGTLVASFAQEALMRMRV